MPIQTLRSNKGDVDDMRINNGNFRFSKKELESRFKVGNSNFSAT